MIEELKPCPFCGGTDISTLNHLDWVCCEDCGASLEDAEPSARELWNRRAPLPVVVAQGQPDEDTEYAEAMSSVARLLRAQGDVLALADLIEKDQIDLDNMGTHHRGLIVAALRGYLAERVPSEAAKIAKEIYDQLYCCVKDFDNVGRHRLELIRDLAKEMNAVVSRQSPAEKAAQDNLREAWSALALIRETIETLGPVGALPASEHLDGPTFMHEAEALVQGIQLMALAGRSQPVNATVLEVASHMTRLLYNDATLDDASPEQKRAWIEAAKALTTIFNITRKTTEEPRG